FETRQEWQALGLLVALLMFLVPGSLTAQERGQIAGQVTAADGTPVVGADIRVPGAGVQGATAGNGQFVIRRVPAGTYTLEVYAIGYQDETTEVTVPAGGVANVEVRLEVRPVEVQGVQVHVLRPDLRHTEQMEADAVRETNPRDVGEALRDIAGVDAVRRGPLGLDPAVRGLRETQVGTYMNGTRMFPAGPARMDSPLTHLDPSAIQHVEVVKGPYALTWGAGNMSAIRVDTRAIPPQIPGALHGNLITGYDANVEAQEYAGSVYGSTGSIAYWGHGVWRSGNDYEFGNFDSDAGDQLVEGDYESWETRGRVGVRTGDASWLTFSAGYQDQTDLDYPGRLLNAEFFETVNLAAEWELDRAEGLLRSANVLAYVNDVEHGMNNVGKPTRMDMPGRMPPFALDVEVNADVRVSGGRAAVTLAPDDWEIQLGGDVYSVDRLARRNIDALDPDQPTPPLFPFEDLMWPDASITDAGVWARADRPLTDNTSLTTAVRVDFVSADAKQPSQAFLDNLSTLEGRTVTEADLEDSETNFNAATTLSWTVNPNWSLSGGLGTVVRTADATERYSDRIPATKAQLSTEFEGNPFLDPERSLQGDVWVEARYPRFSWDLNVYARKVYDYVTVEPTELPFLLPLTASLGNTTVFQYVNGEANFYGVETDAGYAFTDQISGTVGIEYTYGQDTELDEPAFGVAPLRSRFGVRYEEQNGTYFVETRLTAVAEQDRLATTRGEVTPTPGYGLVNLQGGFRPYEGILIRAGINNIFDKYYVNHLNAKNPFTGEQIPEMGRVLFVRANYSF
ncbi:MAG: TonB-dependent receptor domain-containing protein, partial [Gemmatimonadota bacterium]